MVLLARGYGVPQARFVWIGETFRKMLGLGGSIWGTEAPDVDAFRQHPLGRLPFHALGRGALATPGDVRRLKSCVHRDFHIADRHIGDGVFPLGANVSLVRSFVLVEEGYQSARERLAVVGDGPRHCPFGAPASYGCEQK